MKYIDADKLKQEIEKRFWAYGTPLHDEEVTTKADEILSFIDSLPDEHLRDSTKMISEDERIRKWMVELVESQMPKTFIEVKKQDVFAWLERQKEQKPVQSKEEKEYVRTLKGLVSDFIRDSGGGITDVEYYQNICDWLDGRHIEQKPVVTHGETYHVDTLGTQQVIAGKMPQKSAEWSEEEEKDIQEASDYLRDYANNFVQGGNSKLYIQSLADRIESLRPQPQGIYQQVVKGLRDMCDRYEQNGMFTDERARDFLGNVRVKCKDAIECAAILDEPSWKPSENQMSMLLAVINDPNNAGSASCHLSLKSLYNDLKKL